MHDQKWPKSLPGIDMKNLTGIAGPLLLAGMFGYMMTVSWRKWSDILIDFGHELYVPLQLLSGKILYSDIAHLTGPLSQYFNALLFYCFGVSFTTLAHANLVVLALLCIILYVAFSHLFGRFVAFACCLVFICMFAFPQYNEFGNYNFVGPYSHEATHGIFLSAVMMCLLWRFLQYRKDYLLLVAGVLLGLILLTRAEVALAATGFVMSFLCLYLAGNDKKLKQSIANLPIEFENIQNLVLINVNNLLSRIEHKLTEEDYEPMKK